MLHKILLILAKGSVHTFADISRELGISVDMTEQLVDNLLRLGYLRESFLSSSCVSGGCSGCSGGTSCSFFSQNARSWELTEKGKLAIR